MVEHLQDCAVDSLLIEGEDAERDKSHVADGAIRDQFLQVGLHDRHECAVDDGDHREDDHERRKELCAIGEERNRKANEAVAAKLQQHASQDHRACSWGLHVRVWEPGVEREHRHLDGEGEREGGKSEDLKRWVGDRAPQRQQVERPCPRAGGGLVAEGGGEDRHEHQERADERIEDELDRRVDAVGPTPDADDQIHRHEHDLPEDVEEEEVERQEDAEHPGLEDKEADEVFLHAGLNRTEAREDTDPTQQRRQDNECAREPVNAKVIGDAERWDPRELLAEGEFAALAANADQHAEAQRKGDQRDAKCGDADQAWSRRWEERDAEGAEERQEDDQRQDRHVVHPAITRYAAAIATRPNAIPSA